MKPPIRWRNGLLRNRRIFAQPDEFLIQERTLLSELAGCSLSTRIPPTSVGPAV